MDNRLQGFTPVVALMTRIADSGNKFPRVRLDLDGTPLVLTMAGAKARIPGSVYLTDGGRYPNNTYFGAITPDGAFKHTAATAKLDQAVKELLWTTLKRMRNGEAEAVFAENGKRLGKCCMCGRDLSDQASVERGIGPICAEKAFG